MITIAAMWLGAHYGYEVRGLPVFLVVDMVIAWMWANGGRA